MNELLRKRRLGDDRGFTLVELLVVIVILGILIAIAVPIFLNQRTAAQNRAVESDIRNAIPAMETYYAEHGDYDIPAGVRTISGMTDINPDGGQPININVSDNVTITVIPTGQTYTITGEHAVSEGSFMYDSTTGQIE